jgi:hypothetical protein
VVSYPALLGEPFPVLAYPIEAVLAEKLVTIAARGETTTRDRDFVDIRPARGPLRYWRCQRCWTLSLLPPASARSSCVRPAETLRTLGREMQREWQRLVARAELEDLLPPDYTEAIRQVVALGDPVITSSATSGHVDHRRTRWTE